MELIDVLIVLDISVILILGSVLAGILIALDMPAISIAGALADMLIALVIPLKSNPSMPPVGFPLGGAIPFIDSYAALNLSSLVSKSGGGSFPSIFLTPLMPALSIVDRICPSLRTNSGPFSARVDSVGSLI